MTSPSNVSPVAPFDPLIQKAKDLADPATHDLLGITAPVMEVIAGLLQRLEPAPKAEQDVARAELEALRDRIFPELEPDVQRAPNRRGDDRQVDNRDDERSAVDEFIDHLLEEDYDREPSRQEALVETQAKLERSQRVTQDLVRVAATAQLAIANAYTILDTPLDPVQYLDTEAGRAIHRQNQTIAALALLGSSLDRDALDQRLAAAKLEALRELQESFLFIGASENTKTAVHELQERYLAEKNDGVPAGGVDIAMTDEGA
jgi:hypothetical protein